MQKTAYDMRISDWSSDVCSSDLRFDLFSAAGLGFDGLIEGRTFPSSSIKIRLRGDGSLSASPNWSANRGIGMTALASSQGISVGDEATSMRYAPIGSLITACAPDLTKGVRSEERRVGKRLASPVRMREWPDHK